MHCGAVRKASTKGPIGLVPINFKLTLPPRTAVWLTRWGPFVCTRSARNGDKMGVLAFVVLTVAVFAVLGLVQKLVERL